MTKLKTYGRWAAWERDVLSKVSNPAKAQQVTRKRQREVDDDAHEIDLVRMHIEAKLRRAGQDPETCCIYFSCDLLADWLTQAIGQEIGKLKVTQYLKALGVPQLRDYRNAEVRGWVWRGSSATKQAKKAPPKDFLKLKVIP